MMHRSMRNYLSKNIVKGSDGEDLFIGTQIRVNDIRDAIINGIPDHRIFEIYKPLSEDGLLFVKQIMQEAGKKVFVEKIKNNTNPEYQKKSLEFIGRLQIVEAVDTIVDMLSSDFDLDVKILAVKTLGKIGDRWAIKPLLDLVPTDSSRLDASITNTLNVLDWPNSVNDIKKASIPTDSIESISKFRKQRTVRLFISSTFLDMHEERDVLIKQTFPELRRRCAERDVDLIDVDLRWGITEKQSEKEEVLSICLQEIDQCRPYFIGILGERYGWVPPKISEQLLEEQPWLRNQFDKSVTELEIQFGVLKNLQRSRRAFFYFRDPAYIDRLPFESMSDFQTECNKAKDSLNLLKEKILESNVMTRLNYPDPKTFGNWVLDDLWKVIDKDFPQEEINEDKQIEKNYHVRYAQTHRENYVGCQSYFDKLTGHVTEQTPPLVIWGETGIGKTALVASWSKAFESSNPSEFIFTHYCGCSPESTKWTEILKRLMGEARHDLKLQQNIPDDTSGIRIHFREWLKRAAYCGRVVLVIDGIDKLQIDQGVELFYWLPEILPNEIRIIFTSTPNKDIEQYAKKACWSQLTLSGIQNSSKKKYCENFFGRYRKKLEENQINSICNSAKTNLPLFLTSLTEELRIYGSFENLTDRISYYLDSLSIFELYEKIIRRCIQDYNTDEYPNLVEDSLSLFWVSKYGLSETEILTLLGKNEAPIPQYYWSPFFSTIRHVFTVSSLGRLKFANVAFRNVVKKRLIHSTQIETTMRKRLVLFMEESIASSQEKLKDGEQRRASSFEQILDGVKWNYSNDQLTENVTDFLMGLINENSAALKGQREISEIFFQYIELKDWKSLFSKLSEYNFMSFAWNQNRNDVINAWRHLHEFTNYTLENALRGIIDSPQQNKQHLTWAIKLMQKAGYGLNRHVTRLQEILLDREQKPSNDIKRANLLLSQAVNLISESNYEGDLLDMSPLDKQKEKASEYRHQTGVKAMDLLDEAKRIVLKVKDQKIFAKCLYWESIILFGQGKLDAAQHCLNEAINNLNDEKDHDLCLLVSGMQASILLKKGDLDEAMQLLEDNSIAYGRSKSVRNSTLRTNIFSKFKVALEQKNYEKACSFASELNQFCMDSQDWEFVVYAEIFLAESAKRSGDPMRAFDHTMKSFEVAKNKGLTKMQLKIQQYIIELEKDVVKFDPSVNDAMARRFIEYQVQLHELNGNDEQLAWDHLKLSVLLAQHGDWQKAVIHGKKAVHIATKRGYLDTAELIEMKLDIEDISIYD